MTCKYLTIVLFVVGGVELTAQEPKVYRCFCEQSGLCSSSLVLYSDSSYVFEHGCEASSHLSFGSWRQNKDSIYFTQQQREKIQVIKSVQSSVIPSDSIWVMLLDKDGINISEKISVGLDVKNRGSYLMSPDSSGSKLFVYKRKGYLTLRTLNKLLNQRITIPIDSANNFIITLNLSSNWIWSKHADWSATGNFTVLQKGKSLLALSPNFSFGVYDLWEGGK